VIFHRTVALALLFTGALAASPTITGIYNAAGWMPSNLPNSGIARGGMFTVTGSGLGPSTLQQVESYPLPTSAGLAGVTTRVKVGGVTQTCIMIYAVSNQVAAILPSATPPGTGTLTLSYQGGEASYPIHVLDANFGAFTLNQGGSGPAVIKNGANQPITMINPAHPGDTLVLWGTGLGPISGNETEPPKQVDLGTEVQVLVGNRPATVVYGGRGSSPGLDQINFVVPEGVNGCKASVAVTVHGVTGNVTTMSVAPAGQTTCGDTYGALTAQNLEKAIASGYLDVAEVEIDRIADTKDTLFAFFGHYSLASLLASYGGSFGPSIGSCLTYEVRGSTIGLVDPTKPQFLDAGSELTLHGPDGEMNVHDFSTGYYRATLATEPSTYIQPGAYSLGNGSGGANVASFSWDLTLQNYVTPTNIPAIINRSEDLTLTWSGGSAYPIVSIYAFNGIRSETAGLNSYAYVLCTAEGSAGTFTIPSAILSMLPPDGYGTSTKPGVNLQIAGIPSERFTIAGSPGIDAGIFTVFVSNGGVAKIE
jgi:uncharacterized protein (TIGR03437 family)